MAHQDQTPDFVAETKGQCFLCAGPVFHPKIYQSDLSSSKVFPPPPPLVYSLHYLSRYLKLDMRKVFTGEGHHIPPHLLARVERSRLKAELCEECVGLTGSFSKLYRKLEKVKMEANSCLAAIHKKLERVARFGNKDNPHSWNAADSKDASMAKLEIAEALRKDTLEKCCLKLGKVCPFAKLRKLTWKQIDREKRKTESRKVARDFQLPSQCSGSNYETDIDIGDSDDIASPPSFSNEDEDYPPDEQNHFPPNVQEPETVKQEVTEEGVPVPDELNVDVKMERQDFSRRTAEAYKIQQKYQSATTLKRKVINREIDLLPSAIPPPIIVEGGVGTVEKPNFGKNPETGKYKCSICLKEYTLRRNCWHHYRNVHLKVRHKCSACKIDFPFRQVYKNHYLSAHMGVRFKCGGCDKTFAYKADMRKHQKSAHVK